MHARLRSFSGLHHLFSRARSGVRPPAHLIAAYAVVLVGGMTEMGCDKGSTDPVPASNAAKVEKPGAVDPKPNSAAKPEPVAPQPPKAHPARQPEAQPAGVTQENLDRFIPASLNRLRRLDAGNAMGVTEGPLLAHGAYAITDDTGPRMVNVNFVEVVDLEFERAQFVVGKGETKDDGNTVGKEIDGRLVQRRFYGSPAKSEVIVLLADRIVVRVSVEKAAEADEALAYLAVLDLAGLEGLVR